MHAEHCQWIVLYRVCECNTAISMHCRHVGVVPDSGYENHELGEASTVIFKRVHKDSGRAIGCGKLCPLYDSMDLANISGDINKWMSEQYATFC